MLNGLEIEGITDPSTLACIARSRKYGQYVQAVKNALEGVCPFCVIDTSYNTIALENDYWRAWPAKPAEKNTAFHFLYIPKRHVTDSEELSDEEILALWGSNGIRRKIREMHGYTSRGTLMRDGDATLSAGTIQHLHVHDMIPNGKGRVESPFYKGEDDELAGFQRAVIYEKLRTGTDLDELSRGEYELIKERL